LKTPLSVTLAFVIVVAPLVAFSATMLRAAPAAAALALTLGSAVYLLRRTDWRESFRPGLLATALAASLALNLVSGIGHLFWQTDDWAVRDAILLDLERNPWPVPYALGDHVGLLRATLGMYLVPTLVGKALGEGAGEAALLAQNSILFALCLYAFATTQTERRAQLIAIPLFVLFAGLDSIAWARRWAEGVPDNLLLPHLDPWPGALQFSSHVTQLFWAPHHALAGWASVAAYQQWRAGRMPALLVAPIWAASIFWSPLAALGMVPFLGFALLCDLRDGRIRAGDFACAVAAGLGALPVAVFLTIDAAAIERGVLDFGNPNILRAYASMFLLKVVPWFALAWEGRDRQDKRGSVELALVAVSLLAIATYRIGIANDFAMRVSIPALAILCLRSAPALATIGRIPVTRAAIFVAIVLLGAVTPAVEIGRNIVQTARPASPCNLLEAVHDGPVALTPEKYYFADSRRFDDLSSIFRGATGTPVSMHIHACWPGRRFVYATDPQ
jgi:hypothetical protein